MTAPARVLVVDDSPTMRGLITAVLNADPEVEVIGQARRRDGGARQAIKQLNPDVVTLDIEMPNMSGLEFLEKIMTAAADAGHHGVDADPSRRGGDDRGARDRRLRLRRQAAAGRCASLRRPGREGEGGRHVRSAATVRRSRRQPAARGQRQCRQRLPRSGRKIVAIGSSTGGVEALIAVLQKFPVNCPPTVITQHMPPTFTKSFAERLQPASARRGCEEATDGARLEIGKIYLAPGGDRHLHGRQRARALLPALDRQDPVNGHRPSVDVLFDSVAELAGRNAVGVILTGMGRDGAAGLLKMRHAGARTDRPERKDLRCLWNAPRGVRAWGRWNASFRSASIGEEILKLTAARKEGSD